MSYYVQRNLAEIENDFNAILKNEKLNSKQEQGVCLARLMTEMEHTWDNSRMWDSPEDEKTEQAKLYEKISKARNL